MVMVSNPLAGREFEEESAVLFPYPPETSLRLVGHLYNCVDAW